MTAQLDIRPEMTMEEILRVAPAAHRALFQRYHVGGCSSCGFQPSDTLAQVCKDHNLLDVPDVVRTIRTAQETQAKMQVSAREVRALLAAVPPARLIDVRPAEELQTAPVPEAEPLDYSDASKYMGLPKDTTLVFVCQTGERSLDIAAYFQGHGFGRALSLAGGVPAWRDSARAATARP